MKHYTVTFYEAGDIWMDFMLTFNCWADDEDHAVEQCRDAYQECVTTHIEETEEWHPL